MVYFDHILHTYACQYSQTTGMQNHLFDGRGFAKHQFRRLWSVSEMNRTVYLDQILHTHLFFMFQPLAKW